MLIPVDTVRQQIEAILKAWGMAEAPAALTASIMADTDLAGIDSHGLSMLMMYEKLRDEGRLQVQATPRVLQENAVTALIDAGAGLGHPAAIAAIDLAIVKARQFGLAAVSVFNSHHFGAAGCYAARAAEQGFLALVTSSARTVAVLPTRAAMPMLGTNPIAFAAPARREPPLLLDMATSTVAANKIKMYELDGKAVPEGWVLNGDGQPVTDAQAAMRILFQQPEGGLTPLGATEEMGSHKGYGLALLAQILGATLGGAAFPSLSRQSPDTSEPDNIGHFFLVIDPRAFRPEHAFEDDLDTLIGALHTTKPADPSRPVLVPGDPERSSRARRGLEGIPVSANLAAQIRKVCERAKVSCLLGEGSG